MPLNCLIMGAAGRDFHNFQTFLRGRPEFRVRAFTAAQIPFIDQRTFPRQLAGEAYEDDIPIVPEDQLATLIDDLDIDLVFFSYSDVSYEEIMHQASRVQACGASFVLLGPSQTQLISTLPVIAVTAVRTGAGKSPISQFLARHLQTGGRAPGILRHPMPYGDLNRQSVQRLANPEDLALHQCTIEECEEYEPYLNQGLVIFAGVDYAAILNAAEAESDVILWDGGNNDFSFIKPDLSVVVVDALRPGHETAYYPGETNLRTADIVVINKVEQADRQALEVTLTNIAALNSTATVLKGELDIHVDQPDLIKDANVLVVEDGPTLTHGGMTHGAGYLAAQKFAARELIDPRVTAVGSVAEVLKRYPALKPVVPALGYSPQQCAELTTTIETSAADVVVDASPAGLQRILQLSKPVVRVRYSFRQVDGPSLTTLVDDMIARATNAG